MFDDPEYKKLVEENEKIAAEKRKLDEETKQIEMLNANKKHFLKSQTTLNIIQQDVVQNLSTGEQANHQLDLLNELNERMNKNVRILQKSKTKK